MIGSLVLGALLVPLIAVQSDMPAVLRQGLKKPDGQQFWGMSKNHPMRKELERDPGVLLGRIEDFDLASLRRGDIGKLLNGHVTAKSPAYNFLRNQRSIEVRECNIPIETNHPMRKELERDPGVLLGRIEDFDLASLRRGDIGKLLNGHVTAKSPAYNFLRNQRSIEVRECNIPIETVVMKQGHCIRLRDNTPACKDDQYMRINYEECN